MARGDDILARTAQRAELAAGVLTVVATNLIAAGLTTVLDVGIRYVALVHEDRKSRNAATASAGD